jgi:hypothetical protein
MSKVWLNVRRFQRLDVRQGGLSRLSPRMLSDNILPIWSKELFMTTLTIVIILAMLATTGALLSGIVSMTQGGKFDQRHSYQLMFVRVGLQGITLLLLIIVLYTATG